MNQAPDDDEYYDNGNLNEEYDGTRLNKETCGAMSSKQTQMELGEVTKPPKEVTKPPEEVTEPPGEVTEPLNIPSSTEVSGTASIAGPTNIPLEDFLKRFLYFFSKSAISQPIVYYFVFIEMT